MYVNSLVIEKHFAAPISTISPHQYQLLRRTSINYYAVPISTISPHQYQLFRRTNINYYAVPISKSCLRPCNKRAERLLTSKTIRKTCTYIYIYINYKQSKMNLIGNCGKLVFIFKLWTFMKLKLDWDLYYKNEISFNVVFITSRANTGSFFVSPLFLTTH